MRMWVHEREIAVSHTPRPLDAPEATSGTEPFDHVLLVGNGPAVGWGVRTHDLALPGALARTLALRTLRGAHVVAFAGPRLNLHSPLLRVANLGLETYGSVVVTFGMNSAVRLRSLPYWRRELSRFLLELIGAARPLTPIVVAGIQPISDDLAHRDLAAAIAQNHGKAMNGITESICDRLPQVTFVPLTQAPIWGGARHQSRDEFRRVAELLADGLAPRLRRPLRGQRTQSTVLG